MHDIVSNLMELGRIEKQPTAYYNKYAPVMNAAHMSKQTHVHFV